MVKFTKKMMIGRLFPIILLGLFCLGAGCTRNKPLPRDKILKVALTELPLTMDPALATDTQTLQFLSLIHEALYEPSYFEQNALVPLLALDMPSVSNDGLEYTIRLRTDAVFQAHKVFEKAHKVPRILTAEDFVFAFKRLMLPELNSPYAKSFGYNVAGLKNLEQEYLKVPAQDRRKILMSSPVEGLKAIAPHTLWIKLIQKDPTFIHKLSMLHTSPMPQEVYLAFANQNGELVHPVLGTGPFQISKDRTRVLTRFRERNHLSRSEFFPSKLTKEQSDTGFATDIGKPIPFIEEIEFVHVPDPSEMWNAFHKGDLDVAIPPMDEQPGLQSDARAELRQRSVDLYALSGRTVFFLGFGLQHEVLGRNKLVRQALSAAIDREAWNRIMFAGRGKVQRTLFPSALTDRPPSETIYPHQGHQIELAKSLLKQAGYPSGKNLPTFKLDLRSSDMLSRKLGDFFTEQFSKIGVRVEPQYMALAEFLERERSNRLEIYLGAWTIDDPTAVNFLSHFEDIVAKDAQFQEILEATRLQPKPSSLAKLESIILEESYIGLGLEATHYTIAQPWVRNFWRGYSGLRRAKYLRIDADILKIRSPKQRASLAHP